MSTGSDDLTGGIECSISSGADCFLSSVSVVSILVVDIAAGGGWGAVQLDTLLT